jgi:methyl-accepting chemotaxis protein
MKFRSYGIPAIFVAIIVTISGAGYTTSRLFSGLTDSVEQSRFVIMQQIVQTALADANNKALARAELVADLPEVKRLFAAGDREGLLAELGTVFANQKARHGIAQGQFHVAPATSFLRLNNPAKFGDDLSKFRPLVVAANRDHLPLKGVAISASGPAIFGIAPVDDAAGKPIGTFEFGLDFAPMLSALKNAYAMDFALFIDEKPLVEFATGIDKERLGDQYRVGKFIRYETTNSALMQALIQPQDLAVVSEPTKIVRDFNGLAQGVMLIPLSNASGTMIGVIAAASDFSSTRAAASQSAIWQALIVILAIVILCGFVIAVLFGYLLRPLQIISQRFAALSEGAAVEPINDTARFPIELAPMVAALDELRSKTEGARP